MRYLFTRLLFMMIVLVPLSAYAAGPGAHAPTVQGDLSSTIDELAARFDPQVCADCHEGIFDDWQHSMHSNSFADQRVLQTWRTFIKQGLEREEHLNKMDIKSHCLWCHAPQIKYATDELVSEIIDLIIQSVDDPAQNKREAAVSELSKLNLNCYGCHNMFSLKDGYWGNKSKIGEIYGPHGNETPAEETHEDFKTIKYDYLTSVYFCAR